MELSNESGALRPRFFGDIISSIARTIIALVVPSEVPKLDPSYVDGFDLTRALEENDESERVRAAETLRKTFFCQVLLDERTYESRGASGPPRATRASSSR